MATAKNGSPNAGASKLFKTFDMALRKSERHLVLSTTYGLNNSWSKKIAVGLRLRLDGTFEPVVKLLNNYTNGVSLTATAWNELVARFDSLDRYFDKDAERAPGSLAALLSDVIELSDGTALRFTTSHGSRVIAVYTNSEESRNRDGEQGEGEEEEDGEDGSGGPAAKKTKRYIPVIVMQKITFDGLKHIACCVTENLLRLGVFMHDVNQCKEALIRHFVAAAKTRNLRAPTLQQLGDVVLEESIAARETARSQACLYFRDHFFDLVFCEITRMFLSYIIVDVRQSILIDQ